MAESKKGKLNRWKMSDTIITIMAVFLIIIVIYPLWYVFINSISNVTLVDRGDITILPKDVDFGAYMVLVTDIAFWRSIGVTIFLCVGKTALTLMCTICFAYPLIRKNLKFRKLIVAVLISSMYIDGGLIASYVMMSRLHLYNTVWALILPGCVGTGNIMLLRVYMKSVSQDLMDSAFIDGATNMQTLWMIVLPVSKPCIVVIALQTVLATWNSWFSANLYMPGRKWQPLQLYLSRLLDGMSQYNPDDARTTIGLSAEKIQELIAESRAATRVEYAAMLLAALPLLIIFPFVQKDLQMGIMVGSLKE